MYVVFRKISLCVSIHEEVFSLNFPLHPLTYHSIAKRTFFNPSYSSFMAMQRSNLTLSQHLHALYHMIMTYCVSSSLQLVHCCDYYFSLIVHGNAVTQRAVLYSAIVLPLLGCNGRDTWPDWLERWPDQIERWYDQLERWPDQIERWHDQIEVA